MNGLDQILNEGISLMLIGMGTVMFFLCILIGAMLIMSKAVCYLNKIFPEVVEQPAGAKKAKASSNDEEVAAAVVAAMFAK